MLRCLQVEDQPHQGLIHLFIPSLTASIIHSVIHLHIHPLTTHSFTDSHSVSGTSWAPNSYPFSPTSYSSHHCGDSSAQTSVSLVCVPPGVTSPQAYLCPLTSCPGLSSLCDVGYLQGPTWHAHVCNPQVQEHPCPGGNPWTIEYGSHWVNVLPLGRPS